ncbi:MAG: 23S rRNA (uracil(1939)-C(5))-methyltransferase RlmD [Evtepia gabavorous]|uniref:23S rRNA (uracil(1939)-C(5))-methyltransferase RlmD n=1 Tax=Evtepia gabavorous TaxID=2211183 RepID=UPI003995923F
MAAKKNEQHPLRIEGYGSAGEGGARLEGQAVFVKGALAGEICQVQLLKVGKSAAWGRVTQVLTPVPGRQSPDCPRYPRCGGCQLRHMTYAEELRFKRQKVQDALQRIGGWTGRVEKIHGAEAPDRYRNKIQFPVADGPRVGFFRARSHEVIDAEDCLLQPLAATRLREAFKLWMERYQVPAYDERVHGGLIRHFYVRVNQRGQSLCAVIANGTDLPHQEELVQALRRAEPDLAGVVLSVNQEKTNVILGKTHRCLWGRDYLEDTLCGLTFRLSVPSFYQVNREQAEVLYGRALAFAGLTGRETVLDLYCGIGTITLVMARQAGRAIGAEVIPAAVEDAKANAARNGVTNAEFLCADAAQAAQTLADRGLRPDVICVDPPRKGLAPAVIDAIVQMAPQRLVYVSCDPATLARDVKRMEEQGYVLQRAEAVDLFPRTAHVETVVLLSQQKPDDTIEIDLDLGELDATAAETKATYEEIKAYVWEKHHLKVSSLYISQIKRKCGLEVGQNYNLSKSENPKVPKCPPEKEAAIMDALKHFQMI